MAINKIIVVKYLMSKKEQTKCLKKTKHRSSLVITYFKGLKKDEILVCFISDFIFIVAQACQNVEFLYFKVFFFHFGMGVIRIIGILL